MFARLPDQPDAQLGLVLLRQGEETMTRDYLPVYFFWSEALCAFWTSAAHGKKLQVWHLVSAMKLLNLSHKM